MYLYPATCFNPRSRAGATDGDIVSMLRTYVSIHAPARGSDRPACISALGGRFQSTLPRGERRLMPKELIEVKVSIHAPARGATLITEMVIVWIIVFNPRSRAGSDLMCRI